MRGGWFPRAGAGFHARGLAPMREQMIDVIKAIRSGA